MTWRALVTSLLLVGLVAHAAAHTVPRRAFLDEAAVGGPVGTSPAKMTVSKGADAGSSSGTVSLGTVVGVAIGAGLVVGAAVGFVLLRVRNRRRMAAVNAMSPITTSVVAYPGADPSNGDGLLSPRPLRGSPAADAARPEPPRRLWDAVARLPQGDLGAGASKSVYVEVERTSSGPAVRLKHRGSPSALPQ